MQTWLLVLSGESFLLPLFYLELGLRFRAGRAAAGPCLHVQGDKRQAVSALRPFSV